MNFFSPLLLSLSIVSSEGAEVRIEGLEEKKRVDFNAKLKPRLEFINKRPASTWRADDAAFFLSRLLIRAGYAEALVLAEIPNENLIVLKVKQGTRYKVGSVSAGILGVLSAEELDDYFMQPLIDEEMVKRDDAPYLEDYPELGAKNVKNYLKSLGYWSASVRVKSEKRVALNKSVDITLEINQGSKYTLTMPSLQGVSAEQRAHLVKELKGYVGKVATTQNITGVNAVVREYYRTNGYQFAKISLTVEHVDGLTTIRFKISPGNRFKVRSIIVKGNEKTKSKRFRRYVDDLEGEFFDASETDKVTQKLLRTGTFERVIFQPSVLSESELNLVLEVSEAKAKLVRSYLGYGTFARSIVGVSYTDLNLFGKLQHFNARGEYSGRGVLGEVSLVEPFFTGHPIRFYSRAYALRRRFDGYKKLQSGYEASLSWEPSEHLSTKLYGAMDYASISSVSLTDAELGPMDYLNPSFGVEFAADYRDSSVLPTKGFHGVASLELGSIQGDSYNHYSRTEIETSYRFAIDKHQGVLLSWSGGTISSENDDELPIDLRFFSGGVNSVRSYGERELGPKSLSGDPLGGRAYWSASVEYHYSYSDFVSFVGFLDSGKVFRRSNEFSFSDPSHALGIGVRLNLPIGPVRLEYGRAINQKEGEPSGQLHFAIGASF